MAAVQFCSLVGAVAHIEEEGKLQGGLVAAKDFARDQVRRYVLCARVQRTCQWFAVPLSPPFIARLPQVREAQQELLAQ